MVALVKAIAKADADYRANPKAWTGDSAKVDSGRQVVGRQARGRAGRDGALRLPEPQGSGVAAWLGGGANGAAAKALAQQANFLKDQGRLTAVAPDFSKAVTTEFVTKAMKQ